MTDKEIEVLAEGCFKNYISSSKYDKLSSQGWAFKYPSRGQTKEDVRRLLSDGFQVKCGYVATSIRNVHDRIIVFKLKTKEK